MGVNSLPKTVTRQRSECDLDPGPSEPESSTLTARLPSHLQRFEVILLSSKVCLMSLNPKVAYRVKHSLVWLPTCLGTSYSIVLDFELVRHPRTEMSAHFIASAPSSREPQSRDYSK